MVWTLALSNYLNDAPWEKGATKAELIDYAERTGAILSKTFGKISQQQITNSAGEKTRID